MPRGPGPTSCPAPPMPILFPSLRAAVSPLAAGALALLLAACASRPSAPPAEVAERSLPPAGRAAEDPRPGASDGLERASLPDRGVQSVELGAEPAPAAPAAVRPGEKVLPPAPPPRIRLGPPGTPRSAEELRRQAAERLVAASPERSYLGPPPDILLAIPVLKVELQADGRVRRIEVLRRPSNPQARDTVELAVQAIHRAAPYGDLRQMPRPWVFQETFLFDDQRRFKPMTLDR